MVTNDHPGQKKIQCWINQDLWDKVESLNIPNQTIAVTRALELLADKSQNIPNESQYIPRLEATIEGLRLILEERERRIEELKERIDSLEKDKDAFKSFANYFKSPEYKVIELQGEPAGKQEETREAGEEEIKPEVKTQEEKPAREPRRAQTVKGEKALIRKTCKNCGEEFETYNDKKETCSDKCRTAFNRRKK